MKEEELEKELKEEQEKHQETAARCQALEDMLKEKEEETKALIKQRDELLVTNQKLAIQSSHALKQVSDEELFKSFSKYKKRGE